MYRLFGIFFIFCAMSFAAESPTLSQAKPRAIHALVDRAVQDGLPGVLVYIDRPGHSVTITSGFSSDETPMRGHHLFRIASNSKSFIGALASECQRLGWLSLDDPIARWLPTHVIDRISNADRATIRQCLNHSSGIFDYLDRDAFWDATERDPTHQWTAEDVLVYAFDEPATFEPGEDWSYSNTNYILVGMALDRAYGSPHHVALRELILKPLNLKQTYYDQQEPVNGFLTHGYALLDGTLRNTFTWNTGYGLADGGLVTSAADLAQWVRALGARDNGLNETTRLAMFEGSIAHDNEHYGLGIAQLEQAGHRVIGHGGGHLGYQSDMFYFVDHDLVLVLFCNGSDGKLDARYEQLREELINLILPTSKPLRSR